MRMRLVIVVFFTFFINYLVNGQSQLPLDTVMYLDKDSIMIKAYGWNYRFYDSFGFHCYTLKINSDKEIQVLENGDIIKLKNYDISIDPVFLADTFNLGFVRRVYESSGSSILGKINRTSNFYYSYKCVQCDNNHLELFLKYFGVSKTFSSDYYISIVETGGIEFTEAWYNYFKENVLKGVNISRKERKMLNKRLLFSVEVNTLGITGDISLISEICEDKKEIINENIELLDFPRLKALIARGPVQKQKSVMIIEF